MKLLRGLLITVGVLAVLVLLVGLLARQAILRRAIDHGNIIGARFGLALGANPNAWDPRSEASPLQDAARQGSEEVVRLLLDHKADVNARNLGNRTALHVAALHGHVAAVRLLLERGARVDIVDDDLHTTPLGFIFVTSRVTSRARYDIAKMLIEHGANPNIEVRLGLGTPLYWAEGAGETELAAFLRAHGAVSIPPSASDPMKTH